MENIEQFKPFPLNEKWLIGNYGSIIKPSGGYARQSLHSLGYLCLKVQVNGVWKSLKSHRVIAITWIDNTDNLPTVNHIDGNKTNNSVYNLEWMTLSDNHKHANRIGLQPKDRRKPSPVSDETKRKMSEAKKGKKRAGYRGAWL